MKICISIGHGKSARGGYDSGAYGGGFGKDSGDQE